MLKPYFFTLFLVLSLSACGGGGTDTDNQAPTAAITTPANNSVHSETDNISFTGTGSDPEDGNLSGTSLQWSSNIDGILGTGSSLSTSLSSGNHQITLTASDAQASSGSDSITVIVNAVATNQPPTAVITAPANNSVYSDMDSINLSGTGSDPEDGNLSGASLQWSSDIDGVLGMGNSLSTTLSSGNHQITLTASDAQASSGSDVITVIVNAVSVNQPPAVSITSPINSSIHSAADTISFSGFGNDPEDGNLTGASLQWSSNQDGLLGSGESISTSLSVGDHLIRLTATDSDGVTASTEITISVHMAFTEIGRLASYVKPQGIKISGSIAYVADQYVGLHTVDISRPDSPSVQGSLRTSGTARRLSVSGQYVFLAESTGVANQSGALRIVNVSDVSSPALVESVEFTSAVNDVEVAGNYIYVVTGNYFGAGQLTTIDVTDPTNPSLLDSLDLSGQPIDLEVEGDLAFIVERGTGLRVIDISTPNSLSNVSTFAMTVSNFGDVEINGNTAYVANESFGIAIIDISDPLNLSSITVVNTPDSASDVEFSGNRIYVADGNAGVAIYDISDPFNPSLEDSLDTGAVFELEASGNILFIADQSTGFRTLDITTSSNIIDLEWIETPGTFPYLDVTGGYAYVGDTNFGLRIIDINTPSSLTVTGEISFISPIPQSQVLTPRDIDVVGSTTYFVATDSVKIIDISDPANPVQLGSFSTGFAEDIEVVGNNAFLADRHSMKVFDISNPASVSETTSFPVPGSTKTLEISGNYAYLGYIRTNLPNLDRSGIYIFDISNPASPILSGNLDLGNTDFRDGIQDLSIIGDRLYALSINQGLSLVDISNPASPSVIHSISIEGAGSSQTFSIDGNHAYVTGYEVNVIDISNSNQMVFVESFSDTQNDTNWAVEVRNGRIYIADKETGLKILQ